MTFGLVVWNAALFVVSVVLLVLGSDWLVRGASRLAHGVGVSPLVVGLTVVAFGTSAPEFTVSIAAALGGQADMALGNVVGSNICNVLLILGLTATITPLRVQRQLARLDTPLMVMASVAFVAAAYDGRISTTDGIALFTGLMAYLALQLWMALNGGTSAVVAPTAAGVPPPVPTTPSTVVRDTGLVIVGLALLVGGGQGLVTASVAFARSMGVDELIIGLTIVAVGTSMPEIATSLVAAWRGEGDIAVGNVIGSNIFNILGVIGASAVVSGTGVGVPPSALWFDIPVMVGVAALCLPIVYSHGEITRSEGAMLLMSYVAYTGLLVLKASGSPLAGPLGWGLLLGFVPLVVVFMAISTGYTLAQRRALVAAGGGYASDDKKRGRGLSR